MDTNGDLAPADQQPLSSGTACAPTVPKSTIPSFQDDFFTASARLEYDERIDMPLVYPSRVMYSEKYYDDIYEYR